MFSMLVQGTSAISIAYFVCYLIFVAVHIIIFSKESGKLFFERIAQKQNPENYHMKKSYYFYYGKRRIFYSIAVSEAVNLILLLIMFLFIGTLLMEKDSIQTTDLYGFLIAFQCMMYLAGIYVLFYFLIGARCFIHALLPVRHIEDYMEVEAVLINWIPYGRKRKRFQPVFAYEWKEHKISYIGPPIKQKYEIGDKVTFYYEICKNRWLWSDERPSLFKKGLWFILKPFLLLFGSYLFLFYF